MATMMTREQATAAVQAATARRDAIQANLLDLEGSFGKRLLAGASLTGETKKRWDAAAAGLANLWETFTAYCAVVDHAAELLARTRRSTGPDLTEIAALLTGKSVRLARAPVPLERRTLADSEHSELTLAAALREMERAFAGAAEVVTSAESVWNEVTGRLDRIEAELGEAKRQQVGLAADDLTRTLAVAEAEFGRLRGVLNSDPLALWQRGGVDTARLDRLQEQTAAAVSRVHELAQLRDDAKRLGLAAALLAITAFTGCLILVLLCFAFVYGLVTLGIWIWAAFLIVAGVCALLAALAVLIVIVKVRGVSGLRKTRQTVQQDLALLKRDEDQPARPAVEAG